MKLDVEYKELRNEVVELLKELKKIYDEADVDDIYNSIRELESAIRFAEFYYEQNKTKKAIKILKSAITNLPFLP